MRDGYVTAPQEASRPALDPGAGESDLRAETLVSVSRELDAEGRPAEALDLLRQANRERRDAEVEEHIVRLQHRVAQTLEATPPASNWPPSLPDPFPEVRGRPPEVSRYQLSAAVLGGAIQHHGALLVRGLVQDPGLERLQLDLQQAFESRRAREEGAPPEVTTPWFRDWVGPSGRNPDFGWENYLRIAESPRAMFDLHEVLRETGLVNVLTEHLQERPVVSLNKCAFRRSPAGRKEVPDYHQDGRFLGESVRTVDLWLALSDCGADAPSLDLLPRRIDHVLETGKGAWFWWTVNWRTVNEIAGDTPPTRLRLCAGDALLFDHLCLHRTGTSRDMTQDRLSIECWFFAPSSYPDDHVPFAI